MRNKPLTQRPISETNDNYGEMWYVFIREMENIYHKREVYPEDEEEIEDDKIKVDKIK